MAALRIDESEKYFNAQNIRCVNALIGRVTAAGNTVRQIQKIHMHLHFAAEQMETHAKRNVETQHTYLIIT